jgi:purine-nucleoside phosphorylase
MEPLLQQLEESISYLQGSIPFRPTIGIICGTGLGGLADHVEVVKAFGYEEIPHFRRSTARSHEGRLLLAHFAGKHVVVLQGRTHYYEGYSMKEVTFPIRILKGIGTKILIITNAAGGLNALFQARDLMVIVDHINLMPENPLRGIQSESLGDRFPDLSEAYDRGLINLAREVALDLGIHLREGVYVGVPGPSLETASETRLLRSFGADAVGMSTVSEVVVARSVGLRVLGLSVISNVNRPDAFQPILLDEIIANTKAAEPNVTRLIEAIVKTLGSEGSP